MRAPALAVACAAALAAAACGKDSSPAAAPPAAPEPTGNPTTAQPTPTPNTPEPSPSPGPTTTPTPAPAPDHFADVQRLDQDPECDALVPASVPEPVTAHFDQPPNATGGCGPGLSDGTGHFAAAVASGPTGTLYRAFDGDGHVQSSFSLTGELWAEPEGWQGVQATTRQAPFAFAIATFFPDGSPRRREEQPTTTTSPLIARDPQGGSLVVEVPGAASAADPACAGEARRFDATGAPNGATGRTGCTLAAAGVSNGGEALVLERASGGTLVRWLRADGTPAAPTATDAADAPFQLVPLLDGSLVGQRGSAYTRRYPHLATASEAVPAWLAARAGQAFRFTRGNRGYAFFPAQGQSSSDCTQQVELVAPDGRRCARVTFRRDGNGCTTGGIDQGWDGSVVQQSASGACSWRVWPRFFAAP